jgi:mRNA interferase HigB
VRVNVISKTGLVKLIRKHPQAGEELLAWYKTAHRAHWRNLMDVRRDFPSADHVGHVLVFNILHNALRLITVEGFRGQRVYVKALLTHNEYDRKEWKKWE